MQCDVMGWNLGIPSVHKLEMENKGVGARRTMDLLEWTKQREIAHKHKKEKTENGHHVRRQGVLTTQLRWSLWKLGHSE